ncbi:MAG: hypothetical protein ACYC45_10850 [Acidithiobacillus ferriphilus]|uniref:hypothetical protein n=1 Tax=Acidithiobacillus ferriphilus TaxID=1689834 RepID=UPI001C07732A|nr:hypothetical protein [Acidithiobacillus ferriphilus]MBU2844644.1 hypothetical protein [Acidithiobacillus ferriphilus]
MKLFGLKFGSVPLAATGNTKADQSPARIYANPQVAIALPKNQEVNNLATDDLLGEADVYWTYGKWHDAMPIYEWWIGNNGAGLGNDVARKYLDCAAKAMDFEAFCRMMEKLIGQNADQAFLQNMAVFGLMRDPSNFDLIGIAEAVDVEESRIISIAQKVVDAEKTPGQRKSDLWKRNQNDAGKISWDTGAGGVPPGAIHGSATDAEGRDHHLGGDLILVRATSGKDYDGTVNRYEAGIFGILCGEACLDDSAAVVDHWKIESVMEHLRREMESRPMRLTVYVDYLRIAHGEGMRDEYAATLLALFSVLLSANAGSGLRRRLLASGRLLGQHWVFDFLSGSQGREFMAVAHKVRETVSVYVPEKAWAKSSEWMRSLVCEAQNAMLDDG